MNSSEIVRFIEQPGAIEPAHVEGLKDLAAKYPYADSLQLLYLSGVSQHKNLYFDDALTAVAYRLSDRERILQLISPESEPVNTAVSEPEVIETSSPVEEIPVAIAPEEPILESVRTNEEPKKEEIADVLDFSTTAASLEQDFFVSTSESVKEESTTSEEEVIIEFTVEDDSKDAAHETTEEPVAEESPEESGQVVREEKTDRQLSFTSWLHKGQNEKQNENERIEEKPKSVKDEIIDRFIEKQPSISKPTAEFYSPSKKAKESLDESRMPVSETLAKIYEAQGNYPKAIHVYHQLILNNPEKKSLFAPRIEELKNKITQ